MDDVERQLDLDVVAAAFGRVARDLGADHQLARQPLGVRLAQGKREDVGRLVVIEILLVEAMNGDVVDEGEADLRILDALAFEHGAGDFAHAAAINRDGLLRTGDCYLHPLHYGDAGGRSNRCLSRQEAKGGIHPAFRSMNKKVENETAKMAVCIKAYN